MFFTNLWRTKAVIEHDAKQIENERIAWRIIDLCWRAFEIEFEKSSMCAPCQLVLISCFVFFFVRFFSSLLWFGIARRDPGRNARHKKNNYKFDRDIEFNLLCLCFHNRALAGYLIRTNCFSYCSDNRKSCRTFGACISRFVVFVGGNCASHKSLSRVSTVIVVEFHFMKMRRTLVCRLEMASEIHLPDSEQVRDVRPIVWPILGNLLGPHSPAIPSISDDPSTGRTCTGERKIEM